MGVIIVLEITCGVGGTSAGCDMPPRPSDKRSLCGRMAGDNISTIEEEDEADHFNYDSAAFFIVHETKRELPTEKMSGLRQDIQEEDKQ
eukprot:scaffold616_cov146-Skeletonema_menzelii.AAC.12